MYTLKNSVRLVGNLGMDPEIKDFDANRKLARLSLATNENYKNDKGEKVTETHWHNLVLWGAQLSLPKNTLKKATKLLWKVN